MLFLLHWEVEVSMILYFLLVDLKTCYYPSKHLVTYAYTSLFYFNTMCRYIWHMANYNTVCVLPRYITCCSSEFTCCSTELTVLYGLFIQLNTTHVCFFGRGVPVFLCQGHSRYVSSFSRNPNSGLNLVNNIVHAWLCLQLWHTHVQCFCPVVNIGAIINMEVVSEL